MIYFCIIRIFFLEFCLVLLFEVYSCFLILLYSLFLSLWKELKHFCSSLGCMFLCVTIPCSPPLPSGFDVRGGPELSCHRPSLPPAPHQSAWLGAGVRGASPRARCQAGLLHGQFGLCVVGTYICADIFIFCACALIGGIVVAPGIGTALVS